MPNVIPVVDSGETEEAWVLAMPRADMSLRQLLDQAGGSLSVEKTLDVLRDVATALRALEMEVVHRDIKPPNVLLYQGHWCLADFGIARFAKLRQAPDTHKFSMTSAYAPERWRDEPTANTSDIIPWRDGFRSLAGKWPFPGPAREDFRINISITSPSILKCPPNLAVVIAACLFKAPEARPSAHSLLGRLTSVVTKPSAAAQKLQSLNQVVVQEKVKVDKESSWALTEAGRRRELFGAAKSAHGLVLGELERQIAESAPEAGSRFAFTLKHAKLSAPQPIPVQPGALGYQTEGKPIDVIACSSIILELMDNPRNYAGRAHSLWYCDAQVTGGATG